MKQVARIISTYASDTSGVCSAMFELGGMTIIHDASGCNSTYTTHDEPRWYDWDSLVFISALTETEAVLGDDQKMIDDIIQSAREFSPAFISLAGTPIPMMTGVDFPAIARQIEAETGIPSFGFSVNGMHSYINGISEAFDAVAERLCKEPEEKIINSANVLGLTPLDFSIHGNEQKMKQILEKNEIQVLSTWAMGSSLEEIENAGAASVNLVVSACGLKAAKTLQKRFGTPYVIGTPYGEKFTQKIINALREAVKSGNCINLCQPCTDEKTVVIGESVCALSLAQALKEETGHGAVVVCPVDSSPELLSEGCISVWDEDEMIPYLEKASKIIADPLYKPICPDSARLIELPHEAFSGRIYHKVVKDLINEFEEFRKEYEK